MNIFEIEEAKLELIEEAKKKKKLFKAKIMDSKLNKNGRVYPKSIIKKMVSQAQEAIKSNKLYGSSFHPSDGIGKASNVAWIMRKLEMVKDDVIVTGELLDTSKGKDLQVILKSGGSLGLSIRGAGDMRDAKFKTEKGREVDCKEITTFQLTGCDIVLNPSFDTQFSKANMFESVGLEELDEANLSIEELREDYKKGFRKIFDEKKEKHELDEAETFETWLEDFGLDDDELDRLIREDSESQKLSELFKYEQAILSGCKKTFDAWKEQQDNFEDKDIKFIAQFDEAVESGFKGSYEQWQEAMKNENKK